MFDFPKLFISTERDAGQILIIFMYMHFDLTIFLGDGFLISDSVPEIYYKVTLNPIWLDKMHCSNVKLTAWIS